MFVRLLFNSSFRGGKAVEAIKALPRLLSCGPAREACPKCANRAMRGYEICWCVAPKAHKQRTVKAKRRSNAQMTLSE
jgi:hypothetical protein